MSLPYEVCLLYHNDTKMTIGTSKFPCPCPGFGKPSTNVSFPIEKFRKTEYNKSISNKGMMICVF